MDKEIALEYLSRLLHLIARDYQGLGIVGFESSRALSPASFAVTAPDQAAMRILLAWQSVSPCIPHIENHRDPPSLAYKLLTDERRQTILNHARNNAIGALSAMMPRSSEAHPARDWEQVAQDLISLGRVREAIDLVRAEAFVENLTAADVTALNRATTGDQDGSQIARVQQVLRRILLEPKLGSDK